MNSVQSQSDAAATGMVALPAAGTTVAANDLRDRLVAAIDAHDRVEVDAAAVENVGQAVMQLLVAARTEAERSGTEYRIVNPSAAFAERIAECRLTDLIGLADRKDEEE